MCKRGACYFGADVRLDPDLLRRQVKAGCAVDSISIEQGHGGHLEMLAHAYQFLGQGSAFEKAESGTGVKFDVQVQFSVLSSQFLVLSKISGRPHFAEN
jgi:hypothetical protein